MTACIRLPALLIALALALAACATSPPAAGPPQLTILISIDGFRPDYLDRGVTPTLAALARDGVRASMRPSFPTKTFPNHYTLVTGLRPDRNGIVDNTMLDPQIPGVTFKMSDKVVTADARWWNEATPIWVTAERAGVRTATMFWPGSDTAIQGVRPSRWRQFDQDVPADARADQLLQWLDAPPAQRARFATLYFDDVDTAGHHFGPDSPELNAAAAKVDAAIGRLVAGLKARGIEANLVIVADHGMAATPDNEKIFYDDLLPKDAARTITLGAFLSLYPNPGHEAQVAKALLARHEHMQCWRKQDIPARYHYGANPRVPPYFCLPQTGWTISTRDYKPRNPERGAHGFDPYSPEMAAIFIANGPAFRKGGTLPVFDNVDVYPLVAKLIGVKPQANDGRLADVASALTK
jgi:predicted AlkP superfamily pyrophosphatase or phosphodiesterase